MNSPLCLTALIAVLFAQSQGGFITIDGLFVSQAVGEAALRNGTAVLIGELLVGDFSFYYQ